MSENRIKTSQEIGSLKIYLAGPDVFWEEPMKLAIAKKKLCKEYGFEGLFPLDNQVPNDVLEKGGSEMARWIARANLQMIDRSFAVIANLTPFRGASADVGTAMEIGYAHGRGKVVCGYSNSNVPFEVRTEGYYWAVDRLREIVGSSLENNRYHHLLEIGIESWSRPTGDHPGGIERFGEDDNLMIPAAIEDSGGVLIIGAVEAGKEMESMTNFEKCLEHLRNKVEEDVEREKSE